MSIFFVKWGARFGFAVDGVQLARRACGDVLVDLHPLVRRRRRHGSGYRSSRAVHIVSRGVVVPR